MIRDEAEMMTASWLFAILMACLFLHGVAVGYGSDAVEENRTYTLDQMLAFAIQDEYRAEARYRAAIEKFGDIRPFSNIVNAEGFHIALLKPLFETHDVSIPDNTAADHVVIPDTLAETLKAAVGWAAEQYAYV